MTGYEKAFSLTTLTASINALPYRPLRLGSLGWFEEQGVTQPVVKIESQAGTLSLVATAPRGGVGQVVTADKRKEMTFSIPHLPTMAGIDADELLGVRAFGSESTLSGVEAKRDALLTKMRASLEMTLEAHRIGALKGQILDKDGSVLQDLFTAFGVAQQTVGFALTTGTTKVRNKVQDAIVAMESALGGTPYGRLRVLCGVNFFNSLSIHDNVEKFWVNTPAAQGLAQGNPYQAIEFAGATFERYRGITGCTIGDDDAYLVPEGVPGLFITRYAPANYVETVNTLGLPMYAKAQERAMGKGYDIEAQSNPLNICTRPAAIVKLTKV
jgi:hypothetical protein